MNFSHHGQCRILEDVSFTVFHRQLSWFDVEPFRGALAIAALAGEALAQGRQVGNSVDYIAQQ